MPKQPAMHDRRAVGREIVQHDVHLEGRLDTALDLTKKRDEIRGAMARLAAREHRMPL